MPSSLYPDLIRPVHTALSQAGQQALTEEKRLLPAVPFRRSVIPKAIFCLECGKRNSMLKRHLGREHDLSTNTGGNGGCRRSPRWQPPPTRRLDPKWQRVWNSFVAPRRPRRWHRKR
ncbi:hypothetical protein E6C67_12725 [Azospirillum sp. TSA2s]|nr:hypothetical protein E6C67_12725 [Azospirillum sp. TSA2s]